MTFLSSFGSLGSNKIFNFSSSSSTDFLASFSSSLIISRISSSVSSSSMARESSISCLLFLYSLYASTIGARSLCSFIKARKRFWSLATLGSFNSPINSSYLPIKSSNLSNIFILSLMVLSKHESQKQFLSLTVTHETLN